MNAQLEPYLFFHGKCEEALAHYATVFGGKIEGLMRFEGSPAAEHVPPEFRNRVMHANFVAPTLKFMASDGGTTDGPGGEGNVSLSLAMGDRKEADTVFAALAEGGAVKVPLAEAFWGAYFGEVTDRFGIDWMINSK